MVAARDDVDARRENLLSGFDRDARPAGGVLAIGDYEIQGVLVTEFGDEFLDCAPSGLANDIADEKQFHAGRLVVQRAMCNGQ